jgi:lipoate-protein ligase A
MTTLELLPHEIASGPHNMAADEVLLEQAAKGLTLLRCYGWSSATVSLGYFQSHEIREQDSLLSSLPFVRRPTGGATLVHDRELTYALALPAMVAGSFAASWLAKIHTVIADVLARFGVRTDLPAGTKQSSIHPALCFHQHAAVDLLIGPSKILGSAQRKHRGALLQHGSILLSKSPHTPTLPGIRELTGKEITAMALADRVVERLVAETGWETIQRDWTGGERERIDRLRHMKYEQSSWNCKR